MKLWEGHASWYRGRWRHSIIGLVQVNDGTYAEVPLWCASEPIARRRIDLVCLEAFWLQEWEWVLEDCHKSSCWKNPIGMSVPRPCGSDVYVCSESCRLCLTVVYWLLECNKVPSWKVRYNTLNLKQCIVTRVTALQMGPTVLSLKKILFADQYY
jgi:hypothetical protein